MKSLDLKSIKTLDFPENQYYRAEHPKKQVVLHHSAGWDNSRNMFAGWAKDPARIATCIGICDDGTITQGFSSKFWGHHIGAKHPNNTSLNMQSIGIEICAWGPLKKVNGKYYSWAGAEVPEEKVQVYAKPFKGSLYYEKYTEAEIESVRQLLVHWNKQFGIPLDYHADMWEVSERALSGKPGIWTHVSYRADKSDCHPQPELIEMLKSLK